MQTELLKIVHDWCIVFAVLSFTVIAFIGKHIQANEYKVQVLKGNLYRARKLYSKVRTYLSPKTGKLTELKHL